MKAPVAISRRRFLKIAAGAALGATLAPLAGGATRLFSKGPKPFVWSGEVLGALGGITLLLEDEAGARQLTARCLAEIRRLEQVFSLFVPRSAIRQLNRDGFLNNPPPELVETLHAAERLSELSGGRFDISVQPLWQYLYYLNAAAPDLDHVRKLQRLVDYRRIRVSSARVRFEKPGMQITLNGLAQGVITDKVAELLRAAGLENVLVELGETRALGRNQNGNPWNIGLRAPRSAKMFATVELKNQALATSSGAGTPFAVAGMHHLLDAKTGRSANFFQSVSVRAQTAAVADGLSTALSLVDEPAHAAILEQYPQAEVWLLKNEGQGVFKS